MCRRWGSILSEHEFLPSACTTVEIPTDNQHVTEEVDLCRVYEAVSSTPKPKLIQNDTLQSTSVQQLLPSPIKHPQVKHTGREQKSALLTSPENI